MNNFENIYAAPTTVAHQDTPTRANFIRKTYYHLAGAIGVFALLQALFINILDGLGLTDQALATLSSPTVALVIWGIYLVTSIGAEAWAHKAVSKTSQYLALGLGVLAWSLMFAGVLLFLTTYAPDILFKAVILTAGLFGGLTFIAFTTKKDFSFLGGILKMAFFVVLGLIVASFFGLSLGTWFSALMIAFASAAILYDTSNIIHKYRTDQYIAASLSLFASVALLFWYIIRILLSFASSD